MNAPQKPAGGKELGHLDSLRLRISTGRSDNYTIKGKVNYGEAVFEEVIGQKVSWSTDKNKMNGRLWSSMYNFMKSGDEVGPDYNSELVEWGKRYGVVEGTTWLTIYGEKFQGSKNAINHLHENPEVANKLEQEIYARAAAE